MDSAEAAQAPEIPVTTSKGICLSCWLYLHYKDFPSPPGLAAPPSIPAGSQASPSSPSLPPNHVCSEPELCKPSFSVLGAQGQVSLP